MTKMQIEAGMIFFFLIEAISNLISLEMRSLFSRQSIVQYCMHFMAKQPDQTKDLFIVSSSIFSSLHFK